MNFPDTIARRTEFPPLTPEQWELVASALPAINDAARIGTPKMLRQCDSARALSYDAALSVAMRSALRWRPDAGANFRTYFWRFALIVVRRFWRRSSRVMVSLSTMQGPSGQMLPLGDLLPGRPPGDHADILADPPRGLFDMLECTERQRVALQRYYGIGGQKPATAHEIAEAEGWSSNNVYTHMARGLDRLRARFNPEAVG